MKMQVFAIWDSATNLYGNPMFLATAGQATRSLSDEVNRPAQDNQLYNHPEDFMLYHIADWDSESAQFNFMEKILIVRAQDLKK